jgi:hypothetical protein
MPGFCVLNAFTINASADLVLWPRCNLQPWGDAGAMTKAGQCAAVGAVLMAVWAAVITGTVATNETVVGLMPFAPFYLLCCFGVSARTRASHAHTDTLARAHRHQPAVVSIGQPRISLTTCATSWPVPSGVDVPLATIGPSLQAVGISELASWQAVLMYPCLPCTVETVDSHCDQI